MQRQRAVRSRCSGVQCSSSCGSGPPPRSLAASQSSSSSTPYSNVRARTATVGSVSTRSRPARRLPFGHAEAPAAQRGGVLPPLLRPAGRRGDRSSPPRRSACRRRSAERQGGADPTALRRSLRRPRPRSRIASLPERGERRSGRARVRALRSSLRDSNRGRVGADAARRVSRTGATTSVDGYVAAAGCTPRPCALAEQFAQLWLGERLHEPRPSAGDVELRGELRGADFADRAERLGVARMRPCGRARSRPWASEAYRGTFDERADRRAGKIDAVEQAVPRPRTSTAPATRRSTGKSSSCAACRALAASCVACTPRLGGSESPARLLGPRWHGGRPRQTPARAAPAWSTFVTARSRRRSPTSIAICAPRACCPRGPSRSSRSRSPRGRRGRGTGRRTARDSSRLRQEARNRLERTAGASASRRCASSGGGGTPGELPVDLVRAHLTDGCRRSEQGWMPRERRDERRRPSGL